MVASFIYGVYTLQFRLICALRFVFGLSNIVEKVQTRTQFLQFNFSCKVWNTLVAQYFHSDFCAKNKTTATCG